ncbi:HAD family phosphatase [Nonomuraea sp. NPDC000554]|uniref:HAD family hydrolase n=1 Tax=Nonomuraea sp. NPDC000554 TaxID=3154259 RepID=UPI003319CB0E
MPSDPPQAVLFDLDGTLIDTETLWWEATAAVAASLGLSLGPDDVPHVLGRTVEDVAAHLIAARAGTTATRPHPAQADAARPDPAQADAARPLPVRADAACLLLPRADTVAARLTDGFAQRVAAGFDLIPGALPLLRGLAAAAVPTALVTASPRAIADLVLPRLGHRFDQIVTAEDTPRGKPHPDPYLEAARRLAVLPERCVAIEDSPTGIAAATAAGCRVLVVDPHSGLPELREIGKLARRER